MTNRYLSLSRCEKDNDGRNKVNNVNNHHDKDEGIDVGAIGDVLPSSTRMKSSPFSGSFNGDDGERGGKGGVVDGGDRGDDNNAAVCSTAAAAALEVLETRHGDSQASEQTSPVSYRDNGVGDNGVGGGGGKKIASNPNASHVLHIDDEYDKGLHNGSLGGGLRGSARRKIRMRLPRGRKGFQLLETKEEGGGNSDENGDGNGDGDGDDDDDDDGDEKGGRSYGGDEYGNGRQKNVCSLRQYRIGENECIAANHGDDNDDNDDDNVHDHDHDHNHVAYASWAMKRGGGYAPNSDIVGGGIGDDGFDNEADGVAMNGLDKKIGQIGNSPPRNIYRRASLGMSPRSFSDYDDDDDNDDNFDDDDDNDNDNDNDNEKRNEKTKGDKDNKEKKKSEHDDNDDDDDDDDDDDEEEDDEEGGTLNLDDDDLLADDDENSLGRYAFNFSTLSDMAPRNNGFVQINAGVGVTMKRVGPVDVNVENNDDNDDDNNDDDDDDDDDNPIFCHSRPRAGSSRGAYHILHGSASDIDVFGADVGPGDGANASASASTDRAKRQWRQQQQQQRRRRRQQQQQQHNNNGQERRWHHSPLLSDPTPNGRRSDRTSSSSSSASVASFLSPAATTSLTAASLTTSTSVSMIMTTTTPTTTAATAAAATYPQSHSHSPFSSSSYPSSSSSSSSSPHPSSSLRRVSNPIRGAVERMKDARAERRRKRAERLLALPDDAHVTIRTRMYLLLSSSWCDLSDRGFVCVLLVVALATATYRSLDEEEGKDARRVLLAVGVPLLMVRVCWRGLYWAVWGRRAEERRRERMQVFDNLNREHGTGGIEIPGMYYYGDEDDSVFSEVGSLTLGAEELDRSVDQSCLEDEETPGGILSSEVL